MRFIVMVKGDPAPGQLPSEEMLEAMARYNEELVKAGVMLDGTGLHPSSEGVRIRFSGGKRTVIDGPFTEAKEVVAGYWIFDVKSKEEAIEWAKRAPMDGDPVAEEPELEIRQLFELDEFEESPAVDHHRQIGEELSKRKA